MNVFTFNLKRAGTLYGPLTTDHYFPYFCIMTQNAHPWYEYWFNHPLYLDVYAHRNDDDARQLINLLLEKRPLPKGGSVLDLCCGSGRHSFLLADKGFNVTGVDLSEHLLKLAQADALKQGKSIRFIQDDMRYFKLEHPVDGIFNLFTSFGFFDDDRENFSVFRNVYDHLRPGGLFFFDFLNASHVQSTLIPTDEKVINDIHILQKRTISNGRVMKDVHIFSETYGELKFTESVRLLDADTILNVLWNMGFESEMTLGSYQGDPYSAHSERLIIMVRKP